MAHIAYVRVSSIQQNTERQQDGLAKTGITFDKTYIEKASGKSIEGRDEFKAMMDYAREGDTIHCYEISRFGRKASETLTAIDALKAKGVLIHFIKEGVTVGNGTKGGELLVTIFAGVAEMEREQMLERQREGYQAAKAAGRIVGRGNSPKVPRAEIVAALAAGGSVRQVAADYEVSTNTVSRIKKEMAAAAE